MSRSPAMRPRVALLIVLGWMAGCTSTVTTSVAPANDTATTVSRPAAPDEADLRRRANARLQLAAAYFADGQFKTALEEVKRALDADPKMAEAYNLRGLIYAALGEDELAQESFRRALELSPNNGDVMHNYGWYLCLQKRYAEAQAQFVDALAQPRYRDITRTLLAQGVCQARAGQLVEAERTLQRAYAIEPTNAAIALNLAEVLFQRGDYERARFYIRRANTPQQNASAQSLWLAARIEARAGNTVAANDIAQQLASRFPKSNEAAQFQMGKLGD
ncbi:MAG: type IV pilus biogenesis/stability protein PilW [Ideonella sp.]|nr:type IV pilus biogenesis/stability protein PilW [Ideonella sp.]